MLRSMLVGDLEMVLSWRNDLSIRQYMYSQHKIQYKEHEQWFARSSQSAEIKLLILEIDTESLGFIQFKLNDKRDGVGEWGFYVSPQAPPGTGSMLGRQGVAYAFKELKLRKLYGKAIAYNQKSINFHKKLGFSYEDTLREHYFDGSDYHDVIVFGFMSEDWFSNKRERKI